MYHYVRPYSENLPYFKSLSLDDFCLQLDFFENNFGFVSKSDFFNCINNKISKPGVVLTFDDGIKDHYQYVLPELKKRGLWGIFYITTHPFHTDKLLDVHRIHMLLGKYGGKCIAKYLKKNITKEMLSHAHILEFQNDTYANQDNSVSTLYVKRMLNYYIDYNYREMVIEKMMNKFLSDEADLSSEFYMSESDLLSMHNDGMIIGSHSASHSVMSKLDCNDQEIEVISSFNTIESIIKLNNNRTFRYPYGGFESFSECTELLLEKHNCKFSFNVESRDITQNDLKNRVQALPRYDCNEFPHGLCKG